MGLDFYNSLKLGIDECIDLKLLLYNFELFLKARKSIDSPESDSFDGRVTRQNLSTFEKKMQAIDLAVSFHGAKSFAKEFESLYNIFSSMLLLKSHVNILMENMAQNFELNKDQIFKKLTELKKASGDLVKDSAWDSILELEIRVLAKTSAFGTILKKNAYDRYCRIAKKFDLESASFKNIENHLLNPIKWVIIENERGQGYKFENPGHASHFSAIIGPSFLGKTQFSFVLARKYPVLYFNFSDYSIAPQHIYSCFNSFNAEINRILSLDTEKLRLEYERLLELKAPNSSVKALLKFPPGSSAFIFINNSMKLFTIGFIWSLIEHSTKFDFSSGESWFDYYLKEGVIIYESMSLEMFYTKIKLLLESTPNFRIPFVYIDELSRGSVDNVKLLRNIVRCLVLPCILASTNAMDSKMLNLKSASSKEAEIRIRVNCVPKMLETNLDSIMEYIEVVPEKGNIPAKFLIDFVTEAFDLKVDEILATLNITFDALNKINLNNIWKFMVSQSKTCLQGSSLYAFNEFVSLLKSLTGIKLDSLQLWKNLCLNVRAILDLRKFCQFGSQEKFFSLRMISTNKKLDERSASRDSEDFIRSSIDSHFYHFGEESETRAVLPFNFKNKTLVLDGKNYQIRSHFMKFEQDTFTGLALWYDLVGEDETVATIVKDHTSSLVGILANPEASSKDYKAQEVMSYWTIANASHQNFHGRTGGLDFLVDVVRNLQIPFEQNTNLLFPSLGNNLIPANLKTFLDSLTIPYLIPEKPSDYFKSSLAGICDFGLVYRCANSTGMDIGFELCRNGEKCYSYVECKYRVAAQTSINISKYIANAKAKNSVLTLFIAYKIHEDLKKDSVQEINMELRKTTLNPDPKTLENYLESDDEIDHSEVDEPDSETTQVAKKHKTEFSLSVYCVHFDGQNQLKMKTLREVENPDGVFIVVESNFDVPPC